MHFQRAYLFLILFSLLILISCGAPSVPAVPTAQIAPTETHQAENIPIPTPTLENWANVSSMPVPRFEANAVAYDGMIYVAGGITARNSLKDFARFDPATNTWQELAPLPDFRNHFGMAVINGKIYVSGGTVGEFSFDGQAKTLWVYDPGMDQWEALADMPIGRAQHGMAEIDGKLYVAGGVSPRAGDASELWVYDPATNTWDASRRHLPTQRDHVVVASYEGKLYVAGGRYSTNLAALEIYDPAADTWMTGPDMPTARSGMAYAVHNGQLHTIAGEDLDRNFVFMKHEVFDFASQTWIQLADIPRPLNAPIAASVDGSIYVMGGGSVSGNPYKDVWRFTP